MATEFLQLNCLIPREKPDKIHGGTVVEACGCFLGDIQAGIDIVFRTTCRQIHADGHGKRIEFHGHTDNTVTWRELPEGEEKSYLCDSGARISMTAAEVN